ncbi:MAG: type 4a pilus biogenesis protein PilO [Candidatus Gottesmanbacteria bacterium]
MSNKFDLPEQYRKYYRSLEPILAKPKTKTYSTVIFFFLVVSLFGWYAIKPTVQTILYLRREIVDKKEVNKKMDDKIQALIQSQVVMESVQQKIPLIEDAVPKNPDAIDVVRQLRDLAVTSGASISAIQVASVPVLQSASASAAKSYTIKHTTFPITVSIEGDYQALSSFLHTIITTRRTILFDSISFIPTKKQSELLLTPTIQLVLTMNAYYESP